MGTATPIRLWFAAGISETVRARMSYAFRVFAAIYGYRVVDGDSDEDARSLFYGGAGPFNREDPPSLSSSQRNRFTSQQISHADPISRPATPRPSSVPALSESSSSNLETLVAASKVQAGEFALGDVYIPARYVPAVGGAERLQFRRFRYANEEFHLAFGLDEDTGYPDWLGEIFMWLSSSYELGIEERDEVGRIPYADTGFGRQKISIRKPYASLLMGWLENVLRNGDESEGLCKAVSPVAGVEHMVVSSHDIDFYYTNRNAALLRLIKNLGISIRLYGSWSFFKSSSAMMLEVLGGKRVGDYLPMLLKALQVADFDSTFFVVASQGHRRDPNYQLTQLVAVLQEAQQAGSSVCLHGSYSSVLDGEGLSNEAAMLESVMGKRALGSRQHWLRFDNHEKLFAAIENAQLLFDSTLGFPDVSGFRSGAAFAFPPYNFREERPCNFLEIPLVLMDGTLESESRRGGESAQDVADEVLAESRKAGWGGVSTLWHNPVEDLAVPKKINRVFWESAEKRGQFGEKWMNAQRFLECSLSRYRQAGLLEGVQVDA